MQSPLENKKGFGTAPVFFTAISTILGAILFLRFGYAVGTLGFLGVILVIIIGHAVTIPTALAISEIATNQKVEGGGEYYIISRSFGLNIGATIGIALYMSQAISVAFYVIAFTEAFEPLFHLFQSKWGMELPRQLISIPALILLALVILRKGAGIGVKLLYIVVAVLFVSLIAFFAGKTEYSSTVEKFNLFEYSSEKMTDFFVILGIIFPAFTGMTAGVGLSGDLKNPSKSIPLGTTLATVIGMVIYIFITYKLYTSAPLETLADLENHQLVMGEIAFGGKYLILLGLAASTISSAIGSILVAPRTLQALGLDYSFPGKKFNRIIAKGKKDSNEPIPATLITVCIAFVFVAIGGVDFVAEIITMFFMITYGSICLISFLSHFGADPSYRPSFRSHWLISALGFCLCIFLMMRINMGYAIGSFIMIGIIYLITAYYHKSRKGLEAIFQGAFFQLSRSIQVYLQQARKTKKTKWRPSAICISENSFKDDNALLLLSWISHKYGFGTYIHLIPGYFSTESNEQSKEVLNKLLQTTKELKSKVYIDTMISPTYTSAIAQLIQMPGISGMENNMAIFEYNKGDKANLKKITDNYPLVRAANYDICVFRSSKTEPRYRKGIHIWIRSIDTPNANLMILLSYIIMSHPDWKKGRVKIFEICTGEKLDETRANLRKLIHEGRLQISANNVQIIKVANNLDTKKIICERSKEAGMTIVGFREEMIKHDKENVFDGYDELDNVLFVSAYNEKKL